MRIAKLYNGQRNSEEKNEKIKEGKSADLWADTPNKDRKEGICPI